MQIFFGIGALAWKFSYDTVFPGCWTIWRIIQWRHWSMQWTILELWSISSMTFLDSSLRKFQLLSCELPQWPKYSPSLYDCTFWAFVLLLLCSSLTASDIAYWNLHQPDLPFYRFQVFSFWSLCFHGSACAHVKSIPIERGLSSSLWRKRCTLTTSIIFCLVLTRLPLRVFCVNFWSNCIRARCIGIGNRNEGRLRH